MRMNQPRCSDKENCLIGYQSDSHKYFVPVYILPNPSPVQWWGYVNPVTNEQFGPVPKDGNLVGVDVFYDNYRQPEMFAVIAVCGFHLIAFQRELEVLRCEDRMTNKYYISERSVPLRCLTRR